MTKLIDIQVKELRPYQASTGHYTADTGAGKTASAADADGWIDWAGGECPVKEDTLVEVKYRNGTVKAAEPAGCYIWTNGFAGSKINGADIIAYRLHRETPSEPVEPAFQPAPGTPAESAVDAITYWKTRAESAEKDLAHQHEVNSMQGETIESWKRHAADLDGERAEIRQQLRRTQSKLKARNIKINQIERLLMDCERKVGAYRNAEIDHDQILGNHAKIIQSHDVALGKMVDNVNLALALAESPELNPDHVVTLRRLIRQDSTQLHDRIADMMKRRYDVDLPF